MDLSSIILGPVVTEKSERLKVGTKRVFTLKVAPHATKIHIKRALKEFYNVDVLHVRIMHTGAKLRTVGRDRIIQKRDPYKKALVTVAPKSKPLDLAAIRS